MSSTKISTRFMIVSDTHDFAFGDAEKYDGLFKLPTPKVDVLLHCGDLTIRGGLPSYKKFLKMLGSIDAELKLVIAGNHDLDLDGDYWARKHSSDDEEEDLAQHEKAVELMTGPMAKEAGVTYLVEGMHTFTLKSGAIFRIFTSPYQPEFCDWAFPYERNEDRFNPSQHVAESVKCIAENPIPDFPNVDIIMTHGPPAGILDWTFNNDSGVGCEASLRAVSRARPLLYCFGHIHEAYGCKLVTWKDEKKIGKEAIEKEDSQPNGYPGTSSDWPLKFGEETLMVNAAIMDFRNRPTNSPWLVDLDLPKAE
ncbi:related to metallophosphoesterase domain-containing protein 2 [Rhynchosporium secalis]|uniref:Related to metallophosphoesterase domain-containing protein 2 n=1 Tax=Rhynchosporium secalis TaxID=38038 RepID=A0A1E1MTZ8_RHYSE|nr:related to metallophosphoesterase domain-containing protein 2 [Rhynchosporium secalis]